MRIGPDLAHRRHRRGLVRRIGIGVDEEHARRPRTALGQQRPRRRAHRIEIDRRANGAVGERAFGHFEAQVARHDGHEIAAQAPGAGPVAAAHLEHVAEACGGDDPDARALALEQRVGADGGAMDHRAKRSERSSTCRAMPSRNPPAWSGRRGRHLGDVGGAGASSRTKTSVKVPPTSTPIIRPGELSAVMTAPPSSPARRGAWRPLRRDSPSPRPAPPPRAPVPRPARSRLHRGFRAAPPGRAEGECRRIFETIGGVCQPSACS